MLCHGKALPSSCVVCFCNKMLDAYVKRVLFVGIFAAVNMSEIKLNVK